MNNKKYITVFALLAVILLAGVILGKVVYARTSISGLPENQKEILRRDYSGYYNSLKVVPLGSAVDDPTHNLSISSALISKQGLKTSVLTNAEKQFMDAAIP